MAKCHMKHRNCAGTAVRIVRYLGRTMNACPPCSKAAWLAEYAEHWHRGIAFDRGPAPEGSAWPVAPVPAPWGRDENDPRSEEQKAQSRARRGL